MKSASGKFDGRSAKTLVVMFWSEPFPITQRNSKTLDRALRSNALFVLLLLLVLVLLLLLALVLSESAQADERYLSSRLFSIAS